MATMTLSFNKEGDVYKTSYTSQGDTVVQLERVQGGTIRIYANIEGMAHSPIFVDYNVSKNFLIKVCVPAGMTVTIESTSEVTTGKTLTEDA